MITTKTTIESHALYPREDGTAFAKRRYASNYAPIGEPWPALSSGETVRIVDTQGWQWTAEIVEIDADAETATVRVLGDKEALPFPEPDERGRLRLPNLGGHAHARRWARGDIVEIGGRYYKVAKKPKLGAGAGTVISYELEETTVDKYRTRPGRLPMSSEQTACEAVGSAVETKTGEWLHVKKVTRSSFTGALGRGSTYWATGRHVTPERAAKINDTHAPTLARALRRHHGERTPGDAFPAEARPVVLLPEEGRRVPTGERVAVVDGAVYHERCGDPDMADTWRRYVVRIDDNDLAKRAQRFCKKAARQKKKGG